jgi:hypothetical protein
MGNGGGGDFGGFGGAAGRVMLIRNASLFEVSSTELEAIVAAPHTAIIPPKVRATGHTELTARPKNPGRARATPS